MHRSFFGGKNIILIAESHKWTAILVHEGISHGFLKPSNDKRGFHMVSMTWLNEDFTWRPWPIFINLHNTACGHSYIYTVYMNVFREGIASPQGIPSTYPLLVCWLACKNLKPVTGTSSQAETNHQWELLPKMGASTSYADFSNAINSLYIDFSYSTVRQAILMHSGSFFRNPFSISWMC